ncbi:hypothetical protein BCB68_01180 [Leptotrichia sp. oral taxon 498]|uniref:hypothetical protein n=1 Tax=Leptotrichia sp. oral taxon 498 TaxID=712368 RepID=UPI000B8D0F89|nr:hypothetical protein [Leptotrichia sp. oral taxon 498]ASQ47700.1 hypothetical protein BCB68_01180 [Leptotrichia sp. oral taxon 498]
MALDNKLKSEMTGSGTCSSQNSTAPVPNFQNTQSESEPSVQGTRIDDGKVSPKAVPKPQPTVHQESHDSTEMLLISIEKQLKSLNQSVADLEQEVSSCKNPDYRVVFSKIDSARSSIEKMILGISENQNTSNDSCLVEKIAKFEEILIAVTEKQDKNDRQLAQTLRENANFQIQVRQGMQKDLDVLKEQQSGEQFNPILKEIASMYVEYQTLLEDETISDLSKKNLKALFEQMEDLLIDYDAEITRSEVGDTRQTRSTKIIEKVSTADQEKHNTIATSRKPGVLRGRTVLYPEFVDVYVYDPTIIQEEIFDQASTDLDNNLEEGLAGNIITETVVSEAPLESASDCDAVDVNEEATLENWIDKEILEEDEEKHIDKEN